MPEFVIPEAIIKLLDEADWISLATRDTAGSPNAANKFMLKCEAPCVYLVDFARGKTWQNIKNHERVAFPIMETDNLVDYQLSGEARLIEKGKRFEELKRELLSRELRFSTKRVIEGIRRERGHTSFQFPNTDDALIIEVRVDDIVVRGPQVQDVSGLG